MDETRDRVDLVDVLAASAEQICRIAATLREATAKAPLTEWERDGMDTLCDSTDCLVAGIIRAGMLITNETCKQIAANN